jgi:acid phosphatase type 7
VSHSKTAGALVATLAMLAASAACDSGSPPAASQAESSATSVRIATVGDMNGKRTTSPSSASGKNGAAIAAALKDGSVDAFIGLGDFQYSTARCEDYVKYWSTLWGGTKSDLYWISAPNHDWRPGRNDNLDNFMNGQCPGDATRSRANREQGWIDNGEPYSFDLGKWHVAMLSSALWVYDPARARDVTTWLDEDLGAAQKAGRHLAVAYHEPYFTSDTAAHTRATAEKPWIDVMDRHDVRFTLSASQHNYERSCPVLADDTCTSDAGSGTTAFQVSTGGIGLRQFTSSPDYIVKRFSDTHGWLKLTLEDDGGFSWRFMPVSGPSTDTGSRPPPT